MNHKNDGQIRSYSRVLDQKYGAPGTPERAQFEAEAEAFYSGQIVPSVASFFRIISAMGMQVQIVKG